LHLGSKHRAVVQSYVWNRSKRLIKNKILQNTVFIYFQCMNNRTRKIKGAAPSPFLEVPSGALGYWRVRRAKEGRGHEA
jgi:hypothetical protein